MKISKWVIAVTIVALLVSMPLVSFAKGKVVIWGLNIATPGQAKGQYEAFVKARPDIELVPEAMVIGEGFGGKRAMKLVTAIAAGTAPDVVNLNRPWIQTWGSRGVLSSLNDYIERDSLSFEDNFEAFVKDVTWEGNIYAMPMGTDDRELGWNVDLFEAVGLDPSKAPETWDDMLEYAEKLTLYDDKGDLKQVGFFRRYADGMYSWMWAAGARIMSDDKRKVLINQPRNVETLEWFTELLDACGGAELSAAMASTYETGTPDDPFGTGKYAMAILGSWEVNAAARFWPKDMSWNSGRTPTPEPGMPRITWAGGWTWVIPRGVDNPEGAWEVIKWLVSEESYMAGAEAENAYNQSIGRIYVPGYTTWKSIDKALRDKYRPALEEYDPKVAEAYDRYYNLWSEAIVYTIPASPVGAILWDELVRATDDGVYHRKSAKEALDESANKIQAELDEFFAEYDKAHGK